MWPGGLGKVIEVNDLTGQQAGWNFTASAAVPRSACIGSKGASEHGESIAGRMRFPN